MYELQETTSQDHHLQCLMEYIIQGWPESKTNYHKKSEHMGHSEITWQLSIGLSSKIDV